MVAAVIDSASRRIAADANRRGQRGYIAGIARNLRAERLDEIGALLADGRGLLEVVGILAGVSDAAPARIAATHPPDCACHGEGVVLVDEDRRTYAPCELVSA
jgi:hypothetical protein